MAGIFFSVAPNQCLGLVVGDGESTMSFSFSILPFLLSLLFFYPFFYDVIATLHHWRVPRCEKTCALGL
jgi:hypothetical protein